MLIPEHSRNHRQHGFSLVEVLIALVIMSVGMLGIAGLYVQSMQAGRTSLFRHNAVTLASDISDRIRANPRAGIAYTAGTGTDNDCAPPMSVDCSETEMAANDIFLWQAQAVATLPSGAVGVAFDDTNVPPLYTITVSWSEPNLTQPPSYTIAIPIRAL